MRLQRRVIRGCKSPPGPCPRVCNQEKLLRCEAGWRATGGESLVGNVSEFDSACASGQPPEDGEARNRKEARRTEGAEATTRLRTGDWEPNGEKMTREKQGDLASVSHKADGEASRSQSPHTSYEAA